MPGAHEHLEHMEHAAHAAHGEHGHSSMGTYFGVTMAILGALIAFCAAMVGSERNELTRTLMEQTQAHGDYDAASTKYRLALLELEKLRGSIAVVNQGGVPATGAVADAGTVRRFVTLATHYETERKIFGVWLDSYTPLVNTHFDTAEGYERAQLIAEIAIVVASLAVLLSNRRVWIISVVLGVCCLSQAGYTALAARPALEKGEDELAKGKAQFDDFRVRYPSGVEDKATLDAVDPGGVIRKEVDAVAAKGKPDAPKSGGE